MSTTAPTTRTRRPFPFIPVLILLGLALAAFAYLSDRPSPSIVVRQSVVSANRQTTIVFFDAKRGAPDEYPIGMELTGDFINNRGQHELPSVVVEHADSMSEAYHKAADLAEAEALRADTSVTIIANGSDVTAISGDHK